MADFIEQRVCPSQMEEILFPAGLERGDMPDLRAAFEKRHNIPGSVLDQVALLANTAAKRLDAGVKIIAARMGSDLIVSLVIMSSNPTEANILTIEELNDLASELPIDCIVRFSRASSTSIL
jgi:hypothetical protein